MAADCAHGPGGPAHLRLRSIFSPAHVRGKNPLDLVPAPAGAGNLRCFWGRSFGGQQAANFAIASSAHKDGISSIVPAQRVPSIGASRPSGGRLALGAWRCVGRRPVQPIEPPPSRLYKPEKGCVRGGTSSPHPRGPGAAAPGALSSGLSSEKAQAPAAAAVQPPISPYSRARAWNLGSAR